MEEVEDVEVQIAAHPQQLTVFPGHRKCLNCAGYDLRGRAVIHERAIRRRAVDFHHQAGGCHGQSAQADKSDRAAAGLQGDPLPGLVGHVAEQAERETGAAQVKTGFAGRAVVHTRKRRHVVRANQQPVNLHVVIPRPVIDGHRRAGFFHAEVAGDLEEVQHPDVHGAARAQQFAVAGFHVQAQASRAGSYRQRLGVEIHQRTVVSFAVDCHCQI